MAAVSCVSSPRGPPRARQPRSALDAASTIAAIRWSAPCGAARRAAWSRAATASALRSRPASRSSSVQWHLRCSDGPPSRGCAQPRRPRRFASRLMRLAVRGNCAAGKSGSGQRNCSQLSQCSAVLQPSRTWWLTSDPGTALADRSRASRPSPISWRMRTRPRRRVSRDSAPARSKASQSSGVLSSGLESSSRSSSPSSLQMIFSTAHKLPSSSSSSSTVSSSEARCTISKTSTTWASTTSTDAAGAAGVADIAAMAVTSPLLSHWKVVTRSSSTHELGGPSGAYESSSSTWRERLSPLLSPVL
eukprot:scaffold12665_cov69-Phaeocystis_antarctica.AAC.4